MLREFLVKASTSFCFTAGAKEIARICKPFLTKHSIKNFYYLRLTKKGELVFLTSDVDYAMNYWEAGLPTRLGFSEPMQRVQNYQLLWGSWNLDKEILDFTKTKGCYDGFSLVNRYHNAVQGATFFREHPVDSPSSYYLQHKDELNCWLKNFEYSCRHLIQHAIENPMILPAEYLASEQQAFYPERSVEFSYRGIQSKVSFRELDCLYFHAKGFTWPHIAELLGISIRTVETHCNSIKNHFGLSSRDELAHLAYSSPIIQGYSPRF